MHNLLDNYDHDTEPSQSNFYRMLVLGCFESLITLPITITDLVVAIISLGPLFTFYQGWTFLHTGWEPILTPKSTWSTLKWSVFGVHWNEWINAFLSLVFFVLFGLTAEAKKRYRRFLLLLRKPFGVKQEGGTDEPDVVFKSGRGTNATANSNISSQYAFSIFIFSEFEN